MFSQGSACQCPCPRREPQPSSAWLGALPTLGRAGLRTRCGACGDSLDINQALLLCVLACSVHSRQSQSVFFVGTRTVLSHFPQTQNVPS